MTNDSQPTPTPIHFPCGTPLLLVALGGAIGGGLGGAAYYVDINVYKKTRSLPITLLATIGTTVLATVGWLLIVAALAPLARKA